MENVLGAVWDANSAINAEQEIALNHKTVNHILLNCIKEDRLPTESEKTTLQLIADGCPIIGGDAIYEARSVLGLTYREFDDESACAGQVAERAARDMSSDLRLQPNPANDQVKIVNRLGEPYLLINQLGTVVREGKVTTQGIYVSGLPCGIYQIVCGGNAFPVQNTKLVIIHE